MILETMRLLLRPFSIELVDAAITNDESIYNRIGIISNDEWPENDLREVLGFFRNNILQNGITGFGSWIITNKVNEIIGSAGFIGEPEDGNVEIGFGIIPSKRRNGYCKESVISLVNWAMSRSQVSRVIAHCNIDNYESINVLRSCNFCKKGSENGVFVWEYK